MPTSPFSTISFVLDIVMELNPRPTRILDVGFGNGKYGFLCREYLTYWNSPHEKQHVTIHGIEAFEGYIGTIQKEVYDKIFFGEASSVLATLSDDSYDLALLIDVIEHFQFSAGAELLNDLKRVSKVVIVSTPRKFWVQDSSWGNPFERHQSFWNKQDLYKLGATQVKSSENWIAIYVRTPYAYCFEKPYRFWKFLNRHLPRNIMEVFTKVYHRIN